MLIWTSGSGDSTLSSGGHFVQWSIINCAINKEDIMRNICVEIFFNFNLGQWFKGSCLKVIVLFLVMVAILFSGKKRRCKFGGTFL